MSNLRSRRALPNDYWTADTVEDYMRCKVVLFILCLHSCKIHVKQGKLTATVIADQKVRFLKRVNQANTTLGKLLRQPPFSGDQLSDWGSQ